MAVSDELLIVDLDAGDADAGMALSTEAGWNQTADDWRHFIETGHAIGVRDGDGRLIASAAALPYDGPLGYIGMVLVTQSWRRRGIATRLVDRCIEALEGRNLVPVLDATAAGEAVYSRQGFLPQFRFDRWQGTGGGGELAAGGADVSAVVNLDAAAFGAARSSLMTDFLGRDGTQVLLAEGGEGFAMIRHGRRAWQAGPVVAPDQGTALDLVKQLMATASGPVFIDVPQRWQAIGQWLTDAGFTVQRSFARMALRRAEPFGDPSRLFAVAGPEFG
jgi:GNAT superfamily N-acetyltransferase